MKELNIIYDYINFIPLDGINIDSITYSKNEVIELEPSIKNKIKDIINKYIVGIDFNIIDLYNGVTNSIDLIVDLLITIDKGKYENIIVEDKSVTPHHLELYYILIDYLRDYDDVTIHYVTDSILISTELELDLQSGLLPEFVNITYKDIE